MKLTQNLSPNLCHSQLVFVYVPRYCIVVTLIGSIILGFFQFTLQFSSLFFLRMMAADN